MNQVSSVSVIIPVYNSQATIDWCLQSILNQGLKPAEVLVVDDGSTDNTALIVKQFPGVKLLTQLHRGPAAARNLAAAAARGEILVFLDSDMEFDRDFLAQLTRPIRYHGVVGTWSGNEWVKNWNNVWARCWNYAQGRKGQKMTGGSGQKTVFRAVLKSAFDRVSGFDRIGYTDDWTLVNKLGVEPTPTTAKFYHHNPASLVKVWRQALWIGKRRYKWGRWGTVAVLIRSNPILAFLKGMILSIRTKTPAMIVFTLVYDSALSWGAIQSLMGKKY